MNTTLEAPPKFKGVISGWTKSFTRALHAPKNNTEYDTLCDFSYKISEQLEKKNNKDLGVLLELVVLIIDDYAKKHLDYCKADPNPVSVLKFLMEDHKLVQNDMKKEIGPQGLVSQILSGKRKITLKMAKALAKRFNTSVEIFI